jgi:hypothetical protein
MKFKSVDDMVNKLSGLKFRVRWGIRFRLRWIINRIIMKIKGQV